MYWMNLENINFVTVVEMFLMMMMMINYANIAVITWILFTGFDTFKEEVGISRDSSMKRGISLDVSYDEQDMIKVSGFRLSLDTVLKLKRWYLTTLNIFQIGFLKMCHTQNVVLIWWLLLRIKCYISYKTLSQVLCQLFFYYLTCF